MKPGLCLKEVTREATCESRRGFIKALLGVVAMAAVPLNVFARALGAFNADNTDKVLSELFGGLPVIDSNDIVFKIPDIAENGAVVPVTVSTDIANVNQICIVIDKNPTPLSAVFNIGEHSLADISTRVKIGNSSIARALVRAGDMVYMVKKEVKVTIGGCGG